MHFHATLLFQHSISFFAAAAVGQDGTRRLLTLRLTQNIQGPKVTKVPNCESSHPCHEEVHGKDASYCQSVLVFDAAAHYPKFSHLR